jgi:hypothetical protein
MERDAASHIVSVSTITSDIANQNFVVATTLCRITVDLIHVVTHSRNGGPRSFDVAIQIYVLSRIDLNAEATG